METKTKIVIAGGTGELGGALINHFNDGQHEVVILTRNPPKSSITNVNYVKWDGETLGEWTKEIEGALQVINLTGKSVNCRYNEKNKKEIIDSRVNSTLAIGNAIRKAVNPPKSWINAGSAAIFGNAGEDFKTEEDTKLGEGFSPEVCKAWEKAFNQIETPKTRKVFLRIGMVLQSKGGVLKPLITMTKLGFGGTIGKGTQNLTWIHEIDFLRLIDWIIENKEVKGIIHCASPNPVSNKEFLKELRKALGVPFGFPTPEIILKIGAVVIGTEPELVLSGRKVVSKTLKDKGFAFQYPTINEAFTNLF